MTPHDTCRLITAISFTNILSNPTTISLNIGDTDVEVARNEIVDNFYRPNFTDTIQEDFSIFSSKTCSSLHCTFIRKWTMAGCDIRIAYLQKVYCRIYREGLRWNINFHNRNFSHFCLDLLQNFYTHNWTIILPLLNWLWSRDSCRFGSMMHLYIRSVVSPLYELLRIYDLQVEWKATKPTFQRMIISRAMQR